MLLLLFDVTASSVPSPSKSPTAIPVGIRPEFEDRRAVRKLGVWAPASAGTHPRLYAERALAGIPEPVVAKVLQDSAARLYGLVLQ